MDPITHGLLGAAASYALFGRRLGRQSALLGALAGMAPDIDHFVSSESDPLLYVEFHRYFTHSIAFSIFGSLICTLPWLFAKRLRDNWTTLWACAWPAYLSHCFLDSATSYGTQLMWPFNHVRYGWDLIAVIDPLFSLVLAGGVFISIFRQKLKPVTLSLLFCFVYLSLGGLQKYRAHRAQIQLATDRGHSFERWEVMPTLGNNLVWRSLYLNEGKIYSDRLRVGWFSPPTFREGESLDIVTTNNLAGMEQEGNVATRGFTRFSWFSDNWVARSPYDNTVLGDMRYSISTKAFDPIWGIRFKREGEKYKLDWVNRQLERKLFVQELWAEISGKHPDYRPVPDVKN